MGRDTVGGWGWASAEGSMENSGARNTYRFGGVGSGKRRSTSWLLQHVGEQGDTASRTASMYAKKYRWLQPHSLPHAERARPEVRGKRDAQLTKPITVSRAPFRAVFQARNGGGKGEMGREAGPAAPQRSDRPSTKVCGRPPPPPSSLARLGVTTM